MGDQLENFILENRQEFESEEPREKVWHTIENRIGKRGSNAFWKVAAVVFLCSTVFLLMQRNLRSVENEDLMVNLTEFTQVESYYNQLIAEKKSELATLDKKQLKRSFLMEIERLDEMYSELKATYVDQNSTDILVDAMINNLKLRIEILNQQLKIVNQLNNTYHDEEPKISI